MILTIFFCNSLIGTSRKVEKLGNVELTFTRLALHFFKFIVKLMPCSYKNSCTKILPRIYISSLAFNCIDKS